VFRWCPSPEGGVVTNRPSTAWHKGRLVAVGRVMGTYPLDDPQVEAGERPTYRTQEGRGAPQGEREERHRTLVEAPRRQTHTDRARAHPRPRRRVHQPRKGALVGLLVEYRPCKNLREERPTWKTGRCHGTSPGEPSLRVPPVGQGRSVVVRDEAAHENHCD